ncbi:MAG: hypothetical protein HY557_04830, partial [Euryarchaeota archaeon]|nr:hypothetical protein [Euryarchaeota archaeon]
ALLITVGVVGRLALLHAANVEPVLIISMLAGVILGGLYVLIVPVAIMAITDVLIYANVYAGDYALASILGLGLFVYTGYVFVATMGGFALRRRILWRTKTIAVFTLISVPLTIAYDYWTAFGDWLFIPIFPPGSRSLATVFAMQVPFTLIHVFSSLLFAPILGTMFLAVHLHGVPLPQSTPTESLDED